MLPLPVNQSGSFNTKIMKKKLISLLIISISVFAVIEYNNEYLKDSRRKCKVLDKVQSRGGYRSGEHFYLILKEERKIVFSLIVSPATYSQAEIGSSIYFKLRQFDIKQTTKENVIYVFCYLFFGFLSLVLVLLIIIIYTEP